mgnify:CR=1 FL=1
MPPPQGRGRQGGEARSTDLCQRSGAHLCRSWSCAEERTSERTLAGALAPCRRWVRGGAGGNGVFPCQARCTVALLPSVPETRALKLPRTSRCTGCSAATQLTGYPAAAGLTPPLLGQGYGEAAWLTMASLFTVAASMSEWVVGKRERVCVQGDVGTWWTGAGQRSGLAERGAGSCAARGACVCGASLQTPPLAAQALLHPDQLSIKPAGPPPRPGGVLYYFARTTWEGMEPYVFQQHRSRAQVRGGDGAVRGGVWRAWRAGGAAAAGALLGCRAARFPASVSLVLERFPAALAPPTCPQAPLVLHGVDVGGSRFFRRPVVQRAADFAAMAHRCGRAD